MTRWDALVEHHQVEGEDWPAEHPTSVAKNVITVSSRAMFGEALLTFSSMAYTVMCNSFDLRSAEEQTRHIQRASASA